MGAFLIDPGLVDQVPRCWGSTKPNVAQLCSPTAAMDRTLGVLMSAKRRHVDVLSTWTLVGVVRVVDKSVRDKVIVKLVRQDGSVVVKRIHSGMLRRRDKVVMAGKGGEQ